MPVAVHVPFGICHQPTGMTVGGKHKPNTEKDLVITTHLTHTLYIHKYILLYTKYNNKSTEKVRRGSALFLLTHLADYYDSPVTEHRSFVEEYGVSHGCQGGRERLKLGT